MNWYLLQTKPHAHATADEHLKRQGFNVFIPFIIKTIRKNGKFLDIKTPLFPGYLFMGTSIDPIPWKTVNGTRGISKAVTLDGIYRTVSAHIIEGLKHRCDNDDVIQSLNDIAPGDRGKIKRGPFSDFICSIDQISDDRRAWVLIDLLQQQTRAEVFLDDVSIIH